MSMMQFIPLAPMLVIAVLVFSFMDSGLLALFPVYGTESGLSKDVTSYALGVMIVGNAFLQFFIAWLADRYSKYFVIAGCCLTTVIMLAILPFVMGELLMWPVLVIVGTSGFSIYTVSLAIFGERFKGSALIAGASVFAAMWGIEVSLRHHRSAGLWRVMGRTPCRRSWAQFISCLQSSSCFVLAKAGGNPNDSCYRAIFASC